MGNLKVNQRMATVIKLLVINCPEAIAMTRDDGFGQK